MADIATLGLEVDGRRAFITLAEYDRQLEEVAASGDRVVGSTDRVSRASNQYANVQRLTNLEIDNAASEWDSRYSPAATRAASATEQVGKTSARTTGGVGRLNNALITMTRRMVGANAAAGQLIDVIGTFAIGVGRMTAILAGIAALGLAYRAVTKEVRDQREELEKQLEVLEKIAEAQELARRGGARGVALEAAEEQSRRLAATLAARIAAGPDISGVSPALSIDQLRQRLAEVNRLIAAARVEREAEAAEERARERREDLALKNDVKEAVARFNASVLAQRQQLQKALAAVDAQISKSLEDAVAGTLFVLPSVQEEIQAQEAIERERSRIISDSIDEIEGERDAERERRLQKELDAAQRAAAAKLAEERELQRKISNIARGADILGGVIGGTFGAGLQGGAGGAFAGAGIAAGFGIGGPFGAIAGGAIGFVGGLFSAGRRAREAERLAQEAAKVAGQTLAERRRLLREELNIRSLLVTGDSDAAELARLDARQRQERAAATNLSASDLELLGLIQELERDALIRRRQAERAIEVAQEQLDVLSDQLSEQERTVDTFRNVVANLGAFGESLSLGAFSPLSPSQRLAEARSQFEALRSLALSGDISAAESLPEASRRLLEASRAFNASGLGFVSDFNRVQDTVELVRSQFANQLSVEESIRDELILQRELLEAEILLHEQAIEDTNRQAADALAAWREIQERQEALDQEREDREAERRRLEKEGEAEEREADRQAIEELGRNINDGLGEVGSALNNLTGVVTEERDK